MTNERFFRMLSVAVLGLVALAAIPQKSQATDAATELSADALPIEITIVREVDDINAGRFNPYIGNDVEMPLTTLTQADPNL